MKNLDQATQNRSDSLDMKDGEIAEKLERISNSLEKLVAIFETFKPK